MTLRAKTEGSRMLEPPHLPRLASQAHTYLYEEVVLLRAKTRPGFGANPYRDVGVDLESTPTAEVPDTYCPCCLPLPAVDSVPLPLFPRTTSLPRAKARLSSTP